MEGSTSKYSSIGWAVGLMLHGHPMKRKGWHGRIEFVAYVPAGSVQVPQKFGAGNDTGPFLMIKRKHGPLAPWTITQADLLADDWEMADPVKPGEYHADGKTPLQPTEA